ncbi:MAG: lactate utilization protein [Spirochaetes bacterium]|nr:lactate utilization protein [Spirochaetota bacterium]
MENPIRNYWKLKLYEVIKALKKNNINCFLAETREAALELAYSDIIPNSGAKTISWGGSATLKETKICDNLIDSNKYTLFNPQEPNLSSEEKMEIRKKALTCDLYLTGCNGITEDGILLNLDMIGNRIAALTFGPKNVLVFAGRNKIYANMDIAIEKIKNYTSPINCMRLEMATPCFQSGYCEDCQSQSRICNSWSIIEKCFPKNRITVILINEEIGF